MKASEVWQRLKRACVHRDGKACDDSGSKDGECEFESCPFLDVSYDYMKFV